MNPNDVFPKDNLPPEAQAWRREVENEIYTLRNRTLGGDESILGLNRTSAASLETLADQLRLLEDQVQRINDLYNALPIPYQGTQHATNFGLSSSSWNTVASVSFKPPRKGRMFISATLSGQLVSGSTTTNMETAVRLELGSSASPATPGLAASPDGVWVNNFMSQWSWEIDVDPTREVRVAARIDPVDAASWSAGTGSYAVLVARATFTPD